MNSWDGVKIESKRHSSLHTSKSFPRAAPLSPDINPKIQRANSMQVRTTGYLPEECQEWKTDAFECGSGGDYECKRHSNDTEQLPDDLDKLPIELISLSDQFIDSLSAKVHQSPPSVEKLSGLFQDFYEVAVHHINTHVMTLSSRQSRQRSLTPSASTSTANKLKSKTISIESLNRPRATAEECLEQQMLTTEEIADRRETRRMLEYKRVALEEAIEKRVCEATYDRIWRHRSTHDEERDEKLRSRTAALSLVGIGLKDLGVDLGVEGDEEHSSNTQRKEKEVTEWLAEARKELFAMNNFKYPLGKLQHLKKAHKAIVETLSHFHPSSSADEIMPMLIYTLITSRPEGINIMSNLYFIQRFRNESKVDGEAAYCLTNLEAAIAFLETVDLASLRADEVLSGPPKSASRTNTPSPEIFDPLINPPTPSTSVSISESTDETRNPETTKDNSPARVRQEPHTQNRRLNDLFHPPPSLGAASDAVLNSADQGLETIGNSLGDSYKFILGKFKGRQDEEMGTKSELNAVKFIDDAPKPTGATPDDESTASLYHLGISQRIRADSGSRIEEKIFNMIGGRKTSRDKSVDSSKRVSFAEESSSGKNSSPLQNLPSANPALVESMRNLGNTLNPMNRIAGIGMMRAFGRATPPTTPTIPATLNSTSKGALDGNVMDLAPAFPDLTPAPPPKEPIRVAPPLAKFLELQTPGDMKINEVLELLQDYRRLAGVLKDLGVV